MTTPRAVIFDLDGTLTEPVLDFDAMRAEIGLSGRDDPGAARAVRRGRAGARRGDHDPARTRGDRAGHAGRRLRRSARPPARDGDPDGDPDPQRPRGRRDVRAHVRVPVPRGLHARGRSPQAVAARRAVALPGDGRRARAHARRRRLQIRRDGGPRRRLPDRAGQPHAARRPRAGRLGLAGHGGEVAARAAAAVAGPDGRPMPCSPLRLSPRHGRQGAVRFPRPAQRGEG